MGRSLFDQINKIASELQRGIQKSAQNDAVEKSKHPTAKADDGTQEAVTGEQEKWLREYSEEYMENSPDTLDELETREDHGELGEGEAERSGVEMAFCDDPAPEKPKMKPDDDTSHPANAEKAAFIRYVKSASLSQLCNLATQLSRNILAKSAAEEDYRLHFALGSIVKSSEDVADLAVESAREAEEESVEVAPEEEAGDSVLATALEQNPEIAQDILDALIEAGENASGDEEDDVETVELLGDLIQRDPETITDIVGGLVDGGAITPEEADEILGEKKKAQLDSVAPFPVMPNIPADPEQFAQDADEMFDSLTATLANNPDVAEALVRALVDSKTITEAEGNEILEKLGLPPIYDVGEETTEEAEGEGEPERSEGAEGSSDLDQVADQVINALVGEQASDQLLQQMNANPPPEEIVKQSSDAELMTAVIDAARELGVTFAELSRMGREGSFIAKQAAEFQRKGRYKIQTYKEGSTMRKLVDYMKDYLVELINKNRV